MFEGLDWIWLGFYFLGLIGLFNLDRMCWLCYLKLKLIFVFAFGSFGEMSKSSYG